MSWEAAAWLMLGGSTVLLFLGLPVAFSFLVINLLGAWLFLGGEAGLVQFARNSVGSVASFSLTPIPGSTIATTAMLGSLMLPVMLSRGYHPTMATGPLMAIGAVDMLIPPSALT